MTDLCQWLTPDSVAQDFFAWAGVSDDDLVLEPAAGEGALVPNRPGVIAFELDPALVSELRYWRPDALVVAGDFLSAAPQQVDLGLLNPPYADDGEALFIRQALAWAPRVCALVRTLALHGKGRFRKCWKYVRPARISILTYRPHFLGPGGVPTKFTPEADYMAVECVLRPQPLRDDQYNEFLTQVQLGWVDWR